MRDLIKEYRLTKKQTEAYYRKLTEKVNGLELRLEHLKRRKAPRRVQVKVMGEIQSIKGEREVVSSMANSLQYAIEYMGRGCQPDKKTGIERWSYESREILTDPFLMQSYNLPGVGGCRVHVTEEQSKWIDAALDRLTSLEREVFMMTHAGCLSRSKVAELLNLSSGNVWTLLDRAKKKIAAFLAECS